MTKKKKKKSPLQLALLVVVVTLVSLVLAEVVLLLLPDPKPDGQLSYETMDGQRVTKPEEGIALGFVQMLPRNQTPRQRGMFTPDRSFYLCYADHEALGCDWMDEQGRVLVSINKSGLRQPEEVEPTKPAGQKRIVCIGDSFTFGWGVPEEMGWVRLLEGELRREGQNVSTVNCGAAGAIVIDEYWWGLRDRFAKFDPDVVVVTICLNDLIPCSGLFVQRPMPNTGSKIVDLVLGALGPSPLELDPSIDWVELLLHYPQTEGEKGLLYTGDNPYEAMWGRGIPLDGEEIPNSAPQLALAAMKAWCDTRNTRLLVVLWPFLQGLGRGRYYPFEKLHGLVEAECQRLEIPFHDVLPALRDTPSEELWVTPADMHANPTAHRLALPGIVNFVR